jgi:AcrR family transcriptional regulator
MDIDSATIFTGAQSWVSSGEFFQERMTLLKAKNSKRPASQARRRERRSPEEILERIVRAATEEFKRSGFTGTTTAAIARKAGVTEAQLFRYFGSKSNLLRETIFKPLDEHFRMFVEKYLADDDGGANVRQITHRYTGELQRFIREHSDALTSLVFAQIYNPDTARGGNEIKSLGAYFDRCAAITRAKMKVRPRIDPSLMVRISFVAVLGCAMFKDWIFPTGVASDAEITAAVSDFVLGGITANTTRHRAEVRNNRND